MYLVQTFLVKLLNGEDLHWPVSLLWHLHFSSVLSLILAHELVITTGNVW